MDKINIETNRNLKYFMAKGPSVFLYVALALLGVGVLLCVVAGRETGLLMAGILLVLVGLCVMMFASGGKANEVDIDMTCMALTKDLEDAATKKFEVYERSYLRVIKPITIRGYEFSEDPSLLIKKASDNKVRTNLFNGVYMFFTNDNAYIYRRRLSVTDEDVMADDYHKVKYEKLVGAFLEEGEYPYMHGKKEKIYHDFKFVIKTVDGEVLRMSVEEGADVDKAIKDINHIIDIKHKNPEERLATEGGKYSNR